MRTIAFVSQKDGAGKSTLAASLAVAAREAVAVVDMDPQGSLTNSELDPAGGAAAGEMRRLRSSIRGRLHRIRAKSAGRAAA